MSALSDGGIDPWQYELSAEYVAQQLGAARGSGDSWTARCVCAYKHTNHDAKCSMDIKREGGITKYTCRVCGKDPDIPKAMHKMFAPERTGGSGAKTTKYRADFSKPVRDFIYHCDCSQCSQTFGIAYKKTRYRLKVEFDPTGTEKEFFFAHPDGTKEPSKELGLGPVKSGEWPPQNGWINKQGSHELILYNLPAVKEAARNGETIIINEGEWKADTINEWGLVGTSPPAGGSKSNDDSTKKWKNEYSEILHGGDLYIIADNDETGQKFANYVAWSLKKSGQSIKQIILPNVKAKGDIRDWEAEGNGLGEFLILMEEAKVLEPETPKERKSRKTEGNVTFIGDDSELGQNQVEIWTDMALGDAFLEDHKGIVRHAEKLGWFFWNGKVWVHDEEDRFVGRLAERTAKRMTKIIKGARMKESDETKALKYVQSEAGRKNMLRKAARHPDITCAPDAFDSQPHLLNVNNGVIDLREGVLHEHDPKFMCSKILKINFNPKAECARWERFLGEVFQDDDDMINFIEDALGWTLTGDYSDHKIFFFYGGGRNGKTILLEFMAWLLGSYAYVSQPEMWMSRIQRDHAESLLHTMGSRLVTAGEVKENDKLDVGRVKGYSGGDPQTVRNLYGKSTVTFKPTGKLFMFGNHKPRISDVTNSIWDRWLMVPFNVSFAGREDRSLASTLKQEAEGILYRLVLAAARWYETGLLVPAKVSAATREYQDASNVAKSFGLECFECQFDENDEFVDFICNEKDGELVGERADLIRRAYLEYCRENGIKFPIDKNAFFLGLTAWKFPKRREQGYFYSVKLKDEWRPADVPRGRYAGGRRTYHEHDESN